MKFLTCRRFFERWFGGSGLPALVVESFGDDYSKGEVGFPGGTFFCLSLTNEYDARVPDLPEMATIQEYCMALHIFIKH